MASSYLFNKTTMDQLSEKINKVLINWDPLQVTEMGGPTSTEYTSYIPMIKEVLHNKHKLLRLLEKILQNEMGLNYNPTIGLQKEEVLDVIEQLSKLSES
jgi:hypothetical protein